MELIEDRFDEDGQQTDFAEPQLKALATEAVGEPDRFSTDLSWLLTGRAEAGYRFGYLLGVEDTRSPLLSAILSAQSETSNPDLGFLGGYLRGLSERDPSGWETVLDELVSEERGDWVVELTECG